MLTTLQMSAVALLLSPLQRVDFCCICNLPSVLLIEHSDKICHCNARVMQHKSYCTCRIAAYHAHALCSLGREGVRHYINRSACNGLCLPSLWSTNTFALMIVDCSWLQSKGRHRVTPLVWISPSQTRSASFQRMSWISTRM